MALQDPLFWEIVCRNEYDCKGVNRVENEIKKFKWSNTNRLLGKGGFNGCKDSVCKLTGS